MSGAASSSTSSGAASSFTSFYARKGNVSSKDVTVPQLPWTRNQEERSNSRERRHRSSWHAALNKRIVAFERAEDLLAMVNTDLDSFDVLNTVTALNRLSRLDGSRALSRDFRALEILYRIEAWLSRASSPCADKDGPEAVLPKHLASISTALARLRWRDSTAGRVLRMVASIAPEMIPLARARDLSNLAWAFATLELKGFDSLLLAIAREAVVQIGDFTEQNLSNTCWAYAKIGLRHDPLIKAIADETLKKLPQYTAQGLSNTIWGFATMVIKGEECLGQSAWQLISALLEELITRLPDCPTQQLSNSAWACCRLGVRHDGFMAAIAEQGMRKLPYYTPQDLSNTAMAFAKPNIHAQDFLRALVREAAAKMRRFEAREVSNITWSLSILSLQQPGLIDAAWLDPALEHFTSLVRLDFDRTNWREGDFEGWEMGQLLNACWAHRAELRHWPRLAEAFREHIYGPVVIAMAAIVGRGPAFQGDAPSLQGLRLRSLPAPANITSGAQSRLLSAGPLTHGALASRGLPEAPKEPLDLARRNAQSMIEVLQVDFLGPVFTRTALRELGFVDPEDLRAGNAFTAEPCGQQAPAWGGQARAAVEDALARLKAGLPFMWFDRFGPHERRVQCWVAYELEVEVEVSSADGPLRKQLREGGRIVTFSQDELRAMCQHGQETLARLEAQFGEVLFTLQDVRRAQEWLKGLFAQHDRAGHCERQALLEMTLEVINALRELQRRCPSATPGVDRSVQEGWFDGSCGVTVRGSIRMYVCHFYCISCLAAISNFARRFPEVTFHADYDDCWQTRLLDI